MNIITELLKQQAEIDAKISAIREACSHPEQALTKKHSGNTGNYDPADDCYTTTYDCGLCGKHWSETTR